MATLSLSHAHITQALLDSPDNGKTLDLTKWGFTEVSEASARELSCIGASDEENVGVVTRYGQHCTLRRRVHSHPGSFSIALSSNLLTNLPQSFELLERLRYLNLRQNSFSTFPNVVRVIFSYVIIFQSLNPPHSLRNCHLWKS